MSEVFNIERERELLRGPVGFAHYLGWSFEESVCDRSLSQSGTMLLGMAVNCVLVGFDNEARELLRKAKEWLENAIGSQERPRQYFPGGTEALRHQDLALCNWLLNDMDDRENLDAAVRNKELYYGTEKQDRISISIILPVYIDAGRYEQALSLFEQYWGNKRPANVNRIRGEAAMSYVLAAASLHNVYSDDEVQAAFKSFLTHKVPDFLDHGNYPAVARWLKIAFWNDNPARTSAFETVRKCYDYLPNVVRRESI